ncbi:hypothetical protein ACET3Z_031663 [Daucus carota]
MNGYYSTAKINSVTMLAFRFLMLQLLIINPISSIRLDVSFQPKQICRTTVQGRYLLSDDKGYVCDALSLDPQSRCCHGKSEQYSCHGCNLGLNCCNSYEYCVSCCLNPTKTQEDVAIKTKIAKPITAGTYSSVFDYCTGRCRHSSESVIHENTYYSDFHHCFGLPSNSSGGTNLSSEVKLSGINVIVGKQGESCDTACKSNGHSCVPNKLVLLSQCEMLQKYMNCRGGCLASIGADQPAEVVHDAPKNLNPGACLYTNKQSILSCDGSHMHTRRLCPCA